MAGDNQSVRRLAVATAAAMIALAGAPMSSTGQTPYNGPAMVPNAGKGMSTPRRPSQLLREARSWTEVSVMQQSHVASAADVIVASEAVQRRDARDIQQWITALQGDVAKKHPVILAKIDGGDLCAGSDRPPTEATELMSKGFAGVVVDCGPRSVVVEKLAAFTSAIRLIDPGFVVLISITGQPVPSNRIFAFIDGLVASHILTSGTGALRADSDANADLNAFKKAAKQYHRTILVKETTKNELANGLAQRIEAAGLVPFVQIGSP